MENITWPQAITAIVAIYGAIMATVTFFSRRKEKQRRLTVSFSWGWLGHNTTADKPMLFIEVSNPGNRSVTINVPRIILPDGKTLVFPDPQSDVHFPHKLEEGTKCRIWTEIKKLIEQLRSNGYQGVVKLNADVEDGAGQKYKSKKPFEIDIDEICSWI